MAGPTPSLVLASRLNRMAFPEEGGGGSSGSLFVNTTLALPPLLVNFLAARSAVPPVPLMLVSLEESSSVTSNRKEGSASKSICTVSPPRRLNLRPLPVSVTWSVKSAPFFVAEKSVGLPAV